MRTDLDWWQRRRQDQHAGHGLQFLENSTRQSCNEIGRRDHERQARGARQHYRYPSAQTAGGEDRIHETDALTVRIDLNMTRIHCMIGPGKGLKRRWQRQRIVRAD